MTGLAVLVGIVFLQIEDNRLGVQNRYASTDMHCNKTAFRCN